MKKKNEKFLFLILCIFLLRVACILFKLAEPIEKGFFYYLLKLLFIN